MIPPPSIRMRRHLLSTKTGPNIVSNLLGRAWGAILSLLFLPVYLKFLGIEAYGLVGLHISLLGLITVLDLGLSTTLNRELAKGTTSGVQDSRDRDTIHTFEVIFWGGGFMVGAALLLVSPWIAENWIHSHAVAPGTVRNAVAIMGLLIAIQWPSSLYIGGLMGIQRQVLLNTIQAIAATVQSAGAILVLWLISPTVEAYFFWQILVALLLTAILRRTLMEAIPPSIHAVSFRKELFLTHWKFSAGMTAITALATILTQADKVILSRLLPLKSFGYYILSFNAASALGFIVYPFFSALFPKFSQLAHGHQELEVSSLYHAGAQFVSALMLPAGFALLVFPRELLSLWLRDAETAENTFRLLRLVASGTILNSLMVLPFALQLAYGWTRLSLLKNVVAVALFLPSLVFVTSRWGAIGAAYLWILLNLGYLAFEIPLMHTRLLTGQAKHWYLMDVGLPVGISILVFATSRYIFPDSLTSVSSLAWITITTLCASALSLLAMDRTRFWVLDRLSRVPRLPTL
jgi:O-antigen/teichoic acid export membrane protein